MTLKKLIAAHLFLPQQLSCLAALLRQLANEQANFTLRRSKVGVFGNLALDMVDGIPGLDDELVGVGLTGLPHCLHYFVKDYYYISTVYFRSLKSTQTKYLTIHWQLN